MPASECLREFRQVWLPNVTDGGVARLIDLLEKGSPLLIHGSFSRAVPMGCLATHIAWNHHRTCHLTQEAGINWLNRVAGLNPATSQVIREWDRRGIHDWDMRTEFLAVLREEQLARRQQLPADRCLPALVETC